MEVKQILAELDQEIARLKEARALLAGNSSGSRRGRPAAVNSASVGAPRRRNLTPEGRRRISEALKRRWAARRNAAQKKAA